MESRSNMKRLFFSFLWVCLVSGNVLHGQESDVPFSTDTTGQGATYQTLSLEDFVRVILANHPIIKQADLLSENALQEVRLAKGAFDPKLAASWDRKNFQEKEYYNIFNAAMTVPTWFPIDPKLSLDRNRGVFLNPENSIPEGDDFRQVTLGVSLPIGRGLFIDGRRAAVKQARIFVEMTEAERLEMINKTLLESLKTFWDWHLAYGQLQLVEQSLALSEDIYERIRLDFKFGEAAVIDTVQAAITFQNRATDYQSAQIDFRRASLQLSNFLWGINEEPIELRPDVIPDLSLTGPQVMDLQTLLEEAISIHPKLQQLSLKIDRLAVAEQLARENLKPRVDLNYNVINAPISPEGAFTSIDLSNDFKFGIAFEFPLFLRKERAKLKQTRIKIADTGYENLVTQQQILNAIEANYFELTNGRTMVDLLGQTAANYQRLLDAELLNLELGESDLFRINFQQDKLLEAQLKLLKQQIMLEKSKLELYWAAGRPYLSFADLIPEQN